MAEGASTSVLRDFIKRCFRTIAWIVLLALAGLGLLHLALLLSARYTDTPLTLEIVQSWFAADSTLVVTAKFLGSTAAFVLQYGAYFLASVGLLVALSHIKTIARIISDFREGSGPIYALGTTIANVQRQVDSLLLLEPKLGEMSERIDETFDQITSFQRASISERTGTSGVTSTGPIVGANDQPMDEQNWERLREFWNKNGERLEAVISRIPNANRRRSYRRMPRTNYNRIINRLGDDGIISETARKGSLDLHQTFMSFKPRNRAIPDQVVGDMAVLDALLAEELTRLIATVPESVDQLTEAVTS